MTSVRLFFVLVIITFSLLLLTSVDARSNSRSGRRQYRRRLQDSESLNDIFSANRATKGSKGGEEANLAPAPELPTLPPLPFSTKSPSRSSSLAPTVTKTFAPTIPKGQGPTISEPSPSSAPVTTNTPIVPSPTTLVPTALAEGSSTPAPSTSSGLTPTEIANEQSTTRALLPFSISVTDQPSVDNVRLAIQDYLYQRLTESFSSLKSILLTVTSNQGRRRRKLSIVPSRQQEQSQQRHRGQQEAEGTVNKMFNFTGVAMFYPQETLPTEVQVQRAQLQALEDFHRLNLFLSTVKGYNWQIDIIHLDGMIINKDGMVVGDSGAMVNEGDTLVQSSYQAQGSDDNNTALAVSLSVIFVLVGILAAFFVHRRRNRNTPDEPKETYQELIRSVEDLPKDLEPSPDHDKTINISFESATVAMTSFDSVQTPMTDYGPSPRAGSNMDWNRVFALSQTPVEKTVGEVFEAKTMSPPKSTKIHEIVTLAPVAEGGQDSEPGNGEGDGDSYGYDTLPEGGHQDGIVMSSPVAPPREVDAGHDNDDTFLQRGDHYNQDRDLTIDLSDFNIDPESDPK